MTSFNIFILVLAVNPWQCTCSISSKISRPVALHLTADAGDEMGKWRHSPASTSSSTHTCGRCCGDLSTPALCEWLLPNKSSLRLFVDVSLRRRGDQNSPLLHPHGARLWHAPWRAGCWLHVEYAIQKCLGTICGYRGTDKEFRLKIGKIGILWKV